MWEYRLVWPSGPPEWWSEAWKLGNELLMRRGQKIEERRDTYLVIANRADVGLKLRSDNQFEAKVLHARLGYWELWEKCPFLEWNALEAVRLANMLRLELPARISTGEKDPVRGAQLLFQAAGIEATAVAMEKKRLQATAAELTSCVQGCAAGDGWLAEFVEIRFPNRSAPITSLCLETLEPLRGGVDPVRANNALRCGYPEFLIRHVKSTV